VKQTFVSDEWSRRTIVAGAFRGIRMNVNLAHQTQLVLGLFERETYPWLRRLSQGIGSAIDIGAAHGEYTLFFLKNTAASKIYTFEPDPAMVVRLKDNLELNRELDLERLVVSSKFVGRSNSTDVVCLDSFANNIHSPCLIKIDVDGAEEAILAGATNIINAIQDIRWLIETHSEALEKACIKQLMLAGFRTKIVRNAWWRLFIPELRVSLHNRWLVAWK
jgi:Methyltransferase FkbM domain